MQTISIAVSAILIAAGLVTAPTLINNARDINTRQDLANIAYAQEYLLADQGHYTDKVAPDATAPNADWLGGIDGVKYYLYNSAKNHAAILCDDPDWVYLLRATSPSLKTFYRFSGSTATLTDPRNFDLPACLVEQLEDFIIPDPTAPEPEPEPGERVDAAACPRFETTTWVPDPNSEFHANCKAFPVMTSATDYAGRYNVNVTGTVGGTPALAISTDWERHVSPTPTIVTNIYKLCRSSTGVYTRVAIQANVQIVDLAQTTVTACPSNGVIGGITIAVSGGANYTVLLWSAFGGVEAVAPGIQGAAAPVGLKDSCLHTTPASTPKPSQLFYANCERYAVNTETGAYIGNVGVTLAMAADGKTPTAITMDWTHQSSQASRLIYLDKLCQTTDGSYVRIALGSGTSNVWLKDYNFPITNCSTGQTLAGIVMDTKNTTSGERYESVYIWSVLGGKAGSDPTIGKPAEPIGTSNPCTTINPGHHIPEPGQTVYANCEEYAVKTAGGSYLGRMAVTVGMAADGKTPNALIWDWEKESTHPTVGIYTYRLCVDSGGVYTRQQIGSNLSIQDGQVTNMAAMCTSTTRGVGFTIDNYDLTTGERYATTYVWTEAGGERGKGPGIGQPAASITAGTGCARMTDAPYIPTPGQKFYADCSSYIMEDGAGNRLGTMGVSFQMTNGRPSALVNTWTGQASSGSSVGAGITIAKLCRGKDGSYTRDSVLTSGWAKTMTTTFSPVCNSSSQTFMGLVMDTKDIYTGELFDTFFVWSEYGTGK